MRATRLTSEVAPAVVHADGSSRVQVVTAADPQMQEIIRAFGARTGVPLLINTSFNILGQPIVNSPTEAIAASASCGVDALLMNSFLVDWSTLRGSGEA